MYVYCIRTLKNGIKFIDTTDNGVMCSETNFNSNKNSIRSYLSKFWIFCWIQIAPVIHNCGDQIEISLIDNFWH
jgi:hypothetical protein